MEISIVPNSMFSNEFVRIMDKNHLKNKQISQFKYEQKKSHENWNGIPL